MEHPKLLIVDWVNALLAPVLGPLLEPLGVHTSPDHPYLIPPHIVMTMLIVLAVTALGFFLRSRLSVENPGKLQILAEDGLTMMGNLLEEWIPGKGRQYMPLLLTFFLFILISNYAGLVPGLMAPTSILSTTVGLAITAWVYYHFQGIRAQGITSYLLHSGRADVDGAHHAADRADQPRVARDVALAASFRQHLR
jgi:F-type H+-transporting ATPase subunit a